MKALVLFSGGVDSTTALYWALTHQWEVLALTLDYPSRPAQERRAADQLADLLKVPLLRADIPFLSASLIQQTYMTTASHERQSPASGYIAMRNLLLYAVAGHYAELNSVNAIVAGHTKADADNYTDAKPQFFETMELLYSLSLSGSTITAVREVKIVLPLAALTDEEGLVLGRELGVPFHLTWSCWLDLPTPCGTCYACVERHAALRTP
jgi:7-cyano-7-deazaguanine synthase